MEQPPMHSGSGSTPIPDPTTLTQELVDRATSFVREIIEARLDGMDKAIALLHEATSRIPSEVDVKIAHIKELYEEKFQSVATQLAERRTLNEQTVRASKDAVDAAFRAQMEAVNKSEGNTKEQLNQLGDMIRAMNITLNEKIDASTARGETAVGALRAELLPQITGERSRGDIGAGRQLGREALWAAVGMASGLVIAAVALLAKFQ